VTVAPTEQHTQFVEVAPEKVMSMPSAQHVDEMYTETIRTFLTRPYPVAEIEWTSASAPGEKLLTIQAMKRYFRRAPRAKDKLTGFNFLRAGMEFEFRVNSPKMFYGRLIAAFYPLDEIVDPKGRRNVRTAMMYPSVDISATTGEVQKLTVPYVHPFPFINISYVDDDPANDIGRLHVYVLAPLMNTLGEPATVHVTVFARLIDPVVTAFTDNPITITEQSFAPSVGRTTLEGVNGMRRTTTNPAVLLGMEGMNDLAPSGYSVENDMQLSAIYERRNPRAFWRWTSAMARDHLLGILPIVPDATLSSNYPGLQPPDGSKDYLSTLALVFNLWRGAMRLRVSIVASAFHSGRLRMAFVPDIDRSIAGHPHVNTMQWIMDLQQESEMFITIPWVSRKPWRQSNEYVGNLLIEVVNPLVGGTTETEVMIVVEMYGSKTLEFAVPITERQDPAGVVIAEQCYRLPLSEGAEADGVKYSELTGANTVGESIKSVLHALAKLSPDQQTSFTGAQVLRYMPHVTTRYGRPGHANAFRLISSMFLYQRGAVELATEVWHVDDDDVIHYNPMYQLGPGVKSVGAGALINKSGATEYGTLVVRPEVNPCSHVILPYYCAGLFQVTFPELDQGQATLNVVPSLQISSVVPQQDITALIYVRPAPGFAFGYLVPPPPKGLG
jgi:hypothetical protein